MISRDKIIIMAAPNGARRTPADHPALPVTPEQTASTAAALCDAGVSILHLHVRDDQYRHTLDPARYREVLAAIYDSVGADLIVQVTTEAVGQYTAEQQMAVVRDLKPEAVSIALREICPADTDEARAADFFAWMKTEKVWPQYILYSIADVQRFDDMRRRGVFADDAPFVMFVLGEYANAVPGQVSDLDRLLAVTDATTFPWAVCCFGQNERAVMLAATAQAGHVRLGFENNLLLASGEIAPDNVALIRDFTGKIAQGARVPAKADEVRAFFRLGDEQ